MKSNNNRFKISIMGRTNVGKSTLFNRLIRSNQALVFNRLGYVKYHNHSLLYNNTTRGTTYEFK